MYKILNVVFNESVILRILSKQQVKNALFIDIIMLFSVTHVTFFLKFKILGNTFLESSSFVSKLV